MVMDTDTTLAVELRFVFISNGTEIQHNETSNNGKPRLNWRIFILNSYGLSVVEIVTAVALCVDTT